MFRIAICDDQDDSLRLIDRAVTRYCSERSDLQADISRFDNPLEFLNALHSSGGWDIVILDVCMPEVNGTEIAREIRNRHDRTEIIFISYSTEYAVEAFALNAVHYVLKPLNEKDFREAMDRAMSEGVDVLYVDTAGRLQTKVNLMDELAKIRNVIARKHPGAPHRTVLVLDATTGQNALSQAKLFKESAGVDELILTKLDGTAKGGVAIAVAMQHKLPITYVGLGEKVEDLRPFNGDDYAEALLKI